MRPAFFKRGAMVVALVVEIMGGGATQVRGAPGRGGFERAGQTAGRDFVNVVRAIGDGVWVGHVGLIGHNENGKVTLVYSTEPRSEEQLLMEYVGNALKATPGRAKRGKAEFKEMKFLRLRAKELKKENSAL